MFGKELKNHAFLLSRVMTDTNSHKAYFGFSSEPNVKIFTNVT